MKIQIDIPKELNKSLKIEKIEKDLNTLAELIILILKERYYD